MPPNHGLTGALVLCCLMHACMHVTHTHTHTQIHARTHARTHDRCGVATASGTATPTPTSPRSRRWRRRYWPPPPRGLLESGLLPKEGAWQCACVRAARTHRAAPQRTANPYGEGGHWGRPLTFSASFPSLGPCGVSGGAQHAWRRSVLTRPCPRTHARTRMLCARARAGGCNGVCVCASRRSLALTRQCPRAV